MLFPEAALPHAPQLAKTPLPVLIVEDSEEDALLLVRELQRSGYDPAYERVWSARQMGDALRRASWELIISDYSLPGFDALEALAVLKASELDIPFVLVSGTIGEETAARAMKAGADDYLLKGNLARLGSAIERELREAKQRAGRRAAEAALRESEERLRQMAENVDQAFWLIDTRKKSILYASPACARILGEMHDLIDCYLRPWKAIHPADRQRLAGDPGNRLAQTRNVIYRIVDDAGAVRWIRESTYPILNRTGEVWRLVGTAEDITERMDLEERLRQSQKMDAVGQLAGGIAHDFNNILCVVQGYASLLQSTEKLSNEARDATKEILLAAERAGALTRQLLAISRNQIFQSSQLDLNETVANMGQMLQRTLGENIRLEVRRAPDLPCIQGDAGMIAQILLNLGVNARDAMPQGGTLTIATQRVKIAPSPSLKPDERPGDFACLSVSDSGCGIPAEHVARVFEPFFTTKVQGKGTGLGLAIVYGIVKQHQGWIDLRSASGQGTTFKIYLPAASTEVESPPKSQPLPPKRGKETVLVVEDDLAVRELTRNALSRHGYRVLEAGTGAEAVAQWRLHGRAIDLLLTDVILPDGITGLELADRLHRDRPQLHIVFFSGYPPDVVGSDFSSANFVRKPFAPEQLEAKIRECLDRGAPERQLVPSDCNASRLLLVDDDRLSRQVAQGVMKWHGCELDFAGNGFEVASSLRRHKYDVILVDAALSAADAHELVYRIRQTRDPAHQPWIVGLANAQFRNPEGLLNAGMDLWVPKPLGFDSARTVLGLRDRARPAGQPRQPARAS